MAVTQKSGPSVRCAMAGLPVAACLAAMLALPAVDQARAVPVGGVATMAADGSNVIEIRARGGGGRRGGAVAVRRGPGGARGVVAARPGVRPGYRPGGIAVVTRPGGWVRPYRWAPGGAIAAGAAIGFVSAAAAASYGYRAPQPGLCWYYTDASRRNGFWDNCP
jgi:hypothetical protein